MSTFQPAITIDEVIERLDVIIDDSIKTKNRAGYFAALYRRVTAAVKEKIAEGYFDDNPRMEKLDVVFANRYLEAHAAWTNNEPCTKSWELAFETCSNWRPLVIQHLFVGMNAHIGLDLGIAAAIVQPDDIDSLHDDFNKINSILENLTDLVQDELSEIFWPLKIIDKLAGGADEKIAGFAMGIARDAAWDVALAYSKLSPDEHAAYIVKRDEEVFNFGKKIVSPGVWINIVITVFRIFERGNIAWKIRVLNEGS
ncbi:DUF5995 family protein [Crocinitomicaceae bacterium]|nr:DUF5995 family protein [Crocinitomicaceae bacterium]MDC0257434.1 DUF5995 family protein [Crocinitomicaceae bacterium]